MISMLEWSIRDSERTLLLVALFETLMFIRANTILRLRKAFRRMASMTSKIAAPKIHLFILNFENVVETLGQDALYYFI